MILLLRRRKLGRGSCKGIKEFSKYKSAIEIKRSDQNLPNKVDLLVRWGTTSVGPKSEVTLNTAESIKDTANKSLSRTIFIENNIPTPKKYSLYVMDFPVIVRPSYHSQGKHLYYCESYYEVNKSISHMQDLGIREYYISEYIPKIREYGVFVFDGKVTNVIEKITKNPNAIGWNVSSGNASFKNVNWNNWPLSACDISVKAIKALGLDFGRVDVIEDENNNYYVLEANSAHSLSSEYRKQCFAKALDYFILNGRIPPSKFEKYKTYKFFIHPAIK